ncbi:MAG: secretion protein HlyD [Hyphomicrobiales bacterium]|nr:MAG: secretion protein HlyD [Hyphomicrobiales bacterium]
MKTLWRRLLTLLLFAAIAAATTWALWPRPVAVDVATISRAAMTVVVEDEGVTRIRDVYSVSAPITGKVMRSPRTVGDTVKANETLVAVLEPTDPTFLDARSERMAQAAINAADAAVKLADANVQQAQANLAFARSDLIRARELASRETISARALEKARLDVETAEATLASARATLDVRKSELESAKAKLIQPGDTNTRSAACCVQVSAPVDGRVLSINVESEQVVQAGTQLLEIGDPGNLEVVVDLLSRDAVRVKVGAVARIDGWGGDSDIEARVKRIEPAGFTKVSALGIEEQRVKTVLDIVTPREEWGTLGHSYRVVVHIVVWEQPDAVTVPLAALFRDGTDWAVFRVEDGKAVQRTVTLGERNLTVAQVVDGLAEGDTVILHPNDQIASGKEVEIRDGEPSNGAAR